MDHFPTNWGRPRNDSYDAYGTYPIAARHAPKEHCRWCSTHTPIVTGTSVLAIKYKDGIMMAADNLGQIFSGYTPSAPTPSSIHEYLSQVMYGRRSKLNPLWNSLLVGGFKDGKRFLAYVDLLGTTYTASTLATGYGSYIAQPLLRKASMRVLYYRDARSIDKYQVAKITAEGITISESRKLETSWSFAEGIRGYGAQTQ
ncbi:nucleophile aminohydrolase [Infundibulicybe gibba]|nr:nucleophile aminohydrolase [Infundibulicybe gibba]